MRRTHFLWLVGLVGLIGLGLWTLRPAPSSSVAPARSLDPSRVPRLSSPLAEASAHPDSAPAGLRVNVRGQGVAVADASVRLLERDSDRELGGCVTDTSGSCELGNLRPGSVRAYVHTGRHRPLTSEPIELESGRVRSVDVALGEARFLSGRVFGPDGQPLAGARVGSSDVGSLVVVTDGEGRFELGGLGDEPVNLFASADGFAPRQIRGVRTGTAGFQITLERPATLVGEVAGAPTPGLSVGVCHFDTHFAKEICVARQLLDPPRSTYRFEGLASGRWDVVVEAPGRGSERVAVRLEPGKTVTAPLVTLRAVPPP